MTQGLGHVGPQLDELAGDALSGLGRHEEAAVAYERVAEGPEIEIGDLSRITIKLAWVLSRLGRIADAEHRADRVLALAPHDCALLRFMGELLQTHGDDARARHYMAREIESLNRAMSDDAPEPGNEDQTKIRLAMLYNRTHRFDEAHKLMSPMVARDPMTWKAHEVAADTLIGLGRPGEAIGHLQAAIQKSWSREASPLLKIARLQLEAGDLMQAEHNVRRCLDLAPDHGPAHEALATY